MNSSAPTRADGPPVGARRRRDGLHAAIPPIAPAAERLARSRRPSLRGNLSWTLLGNVIYAGCQWVILVAMARLGTSEMVGQFALAMAVTTPVFIFSNLGLRFVQVTDSMNRHQLRDYLSLRYLTSTGAVFVVIVVCASLRSPSQTVLIVVLAACVRATESVSDVIHGILARHERMKEISISQLIRGILSLGVVTVVLSMTGSLGAALTGMTVVNILVLLAVDIPLASRNSEEIVLRALVPRWNASKLASLAWLSLPVGLSAAIYSLNVNLPRYFIGLNFDLAYLGYFAAAAYLLMATDIVARSSLNTALPRLTNLLAEGRERDFWRLTGKLMALGAACTVPVLIIVWIGGESILAWVYGEEYRVAAGAFFWLMAANVIWQSSVPMAVLLAMRRYWTELGICCMSTIVTAVAAWALVPRYGLVGGAWAIVIGRANTSVGTALFTVRVLYQKRANHHGSPVSVSCFEGQETRHSVRGPTVRRLNGLMSSNSAASPGDSTIIGR